MIDTTLPGWRGLACAILARAIKDARTNNGHSVDARRFLSGGAGRWLVDLLELDVAGLEGVLATLPAPTYEQIPLPLTEEGPSRAARDPARPAEMPTSPPRAPAAAPATPTAPGKPAGELHQVDEPAPIEGLPFTRRQVDLDPLGGQELLNRRLALARELAAGRLTPQAYRRADDAFLAEAGLTFDPNKGIAARRCNTNDDVRCKLYSANSNDLEDDMQDDNSPTGVAGEKSARPRQRRRALELKCSKCGARMPYSAKGSLYTSCRACGADVLNLPIHAYKEGAPARVPKKSGVFLGFTPVMIPLDLPTGGGDCLLCQEPTLDERWIGLVAMGDKSPAILMVGPFCRACVEQNCGLPAYREWVEMQRPADQAPSPDVRLVIR